jgi:hypothetical protein
MDDALPLVCRICHRLLDGFWGVSNSTTHGLSAFSV